MKMCFKPRFKENDKTRVAEKKLGEKRGSGKQKTLCGQKKKSMCVIRQIWCLYPSPLPPDKR